MKFNTPENRAMFVEQFGYTQPDHNYAVDEVSAAKILKAFDSNEQRFRDPTFLWSFIMQDRVTYMLGQPRIDTVKAYANMTNTRYAKIGQDVTQEIITFIDTLV